MYPEPWPAAGQAAIKAGGGDARVQCLRRAVVDARVAGDPALESPGVCTGRRLGSPRAEATDDHARARSWGSGSALIHAVRGRDEEAAASLHEALAIGTHASAAAARELGYIE